MTTLINGKETGQTIQTQIKKEVEDLVKKGIAPCLAVILVGDDPASQVYVRNKKRTCGELGILSVEHKLSAQRVGFLKYQIDQWIDGKRDNW